MSFSIGRLAPGVTLEQAEVELQGVGLRLAADHPETHAQLRPRITTYGRSFFAGEGLALTLLSWARIMVVIVLIIAGVNVGTLVYARSAAREGEISVRNALGASRCRIALQMFAEALVLASLAATVGIGIVVWGLNELMTLMTLNYGGLPFWWEVRVGPSTVLLVGGLTLLAAVLTGVLPALKVTGRRMQSGLQRAGSGGSELHFGRAASAVVVMQVTISVALLTMQGSQLQTLIEDQAFDDGIPREEFLTAELRLNREPSTSDPNDGQGADFARNIETWRELRRRVSREPGVLGATFGTSLPGAVPSRTIVEAEGIARYLLSVFWIEPSYFDVLGVPVRVGRAFDAGDLTDSEAGVAIVNGEFVRSVLAGGEPIGHRIRVDPRNSRSSGQWVEIVGIVPDLAMDLATRIGAAPAIYLPLVTGADRIYLVVHARGEPSQFGGRLRAIVGGLDPALVLDQPRTLEEILDARGAMLSLIRLGIGLLVLAALMLSTIGIYALMSFTVSQRTREIGIRTALGAHPRRVVGDVFSRAILQLAVGTSLGLALGYGATSGRLFEQGARPVVGIAALILMMGLIACGKPVRRALRIQPTEALREGG